MKKYWIILALLYFFVNPSVTQELITEDFSGNDFPPSGWTVSAHEENWILSQRNISGSKPPEAQLYFQPLFDDTTRLISPAVSLTPGEDIRIEFSFAVEHHYSDYSIGIALLKDEEWQSIWELQPDTNISNTRISLLLSHSVTVDSLQLSWYFIGSVFDMYSWFIDDIRVYHPCDRDVAAVSVKAEKQQYNAGETAKISGSIMNPGKTDATPCEYSLTIKLGEEAVYTEINTQNIPAGENFEFELNDFIPAEENRIYDLVLNASVQNDQYLSNDTTAAYFNTYAIDRGQVLAEMATGTWCGTCPGAAMGVDELLAHGKSVAVIGYHVLDNYENAASLYRLGYYFIPAYPTVYFDGTTHFTGGHQFLSLYDDYLPIYEDKISVNAPAALSIYGEQEENDYEILLDIDMKANVRSDHLQAFLVLTESNIPEVWGGGGMEEVNQVERLMIPDHSGLPVSGQTGEYDFAFSFSLEEDWVKENCELIAFIQDTLTYEVFQAEKVKLTELLPSGRFLKKAEVLIEVYPNPVGDKLFVHIPSGTNIQMIQLYSITGSKMRQWNIEENSDFSLDIQKYTDLPGGIYLLKVYLDEAIYQKKLILK
ncbi:MAG: T9SS type A sorting domain-containing protein [Bacteroidota bacterium]|nr:T9SS type A sorting domain-containing protein [Bacteroidota bacterium]